MVDAGREAVVERGPRAALQLVWSLERDTRTLSNALAQVESVTPHADDFDTALVLPAQSACICADAAIRWASGEEQASVQWVEYPYETIAQMICVEEFGYIDLGSTDEERLFRERVVHDCRFKREHDAQTADYRSLVSAKADAIKLRATIAEMQKRARASGVLPEQFNIDS